MNIKSPVLILVSALSCASAYPYENAEKQPVHTVSKETLSQFGIQNHDTKEGETIVNYPPSPEQSIRDMHPHSTDVKKAIFNIQDANAAHNSAEILKTITTEPSHHSKDHNLHDTETACHLHKSEDVHASDTTAKSHTIDGHNLHNTISNTHGETAKPKENHNAHEKSHDCQELDHHSKDHNLHDTETAGHLHKSEDVHACDTTGKSHTNDGHDLDNSENHNAHEKSHDCQHIDHHSKDHNLHDTETAGHLHKSEDVHAFDTTEKSHTIDGHDLDNPINRTHGETAKPKENHNAHDESHDGQHLDHHSKHHNLHDTETAGHLHKGEDSHTFDTTGKSHTIASHDLNHPLCKSAKPKENHNENDELHTSDGHDFDHHSTDHNLQDTNTADHLHKDGDLHISDITGKSHTTDGHDLDHPICNTHEETAKPKENHNIHDESLNSDVNLNGANEDVILKKETVKEVIYSYKYPYYANNVMNTNRYGRYYSPELLSGSKNKYYPMRQNDPKYFYKQNILGTPTCSYVGQTSKYGYQDQFYYPSYSTYSISEKPTSENDKIDYYSTSCDTYNINFEPQKYKPDLTYTPPPYKYPYQDQMWNLDNRKNSNDEYCFYSNNERNKHKLNQNLKTDQSKYYRNYNRKTDPCIETYPNNYLDKIWRTWEKTEIQKPNASKANPLQMKSNHDNILDTRKLNKIPSWNYNRIKPFMNGNGC